MHVNIYLPSFEFFVPPWTSLRTWQSGTAETHFGHVLQIGQIGHNRSYVSKWNGEAAPVLPEYPTRVHISDLWQRGDVTGAL